MYIPYGCVVLTGVTSFAWDFATFDKLFIILFISQPVGLLQMHVPSSQAVGQLEQVHEDPSSLEQAVVEAAASVDVGQGQAGQSSQSSTATPLQNSVSLRMHQFSLFVIVLFVFG